MCNDSVGCRSVVFVYEQQGDNVAKVVGNLVCELVEVWPGVFSCFQFSVDIFALGGVEWCASNSECVPVSVSMFPSSISTVLHHDADGP